MVWLLWYTKSRLGGFFKRANQLCHRSAQKLLGEILGWPEKMIPKIPSCPWSSPSWPWPLSYALVLSQYRKSRISFQQLPEARTCPFLHLKRWVWTSALVTERRLYMEWRQLWRETAVGKVQLCNLSAPSPPELQKRTVPFPLLPEGWNRKMPLRKSDLCFLGSLLHAGWLKFFAINSEGKGFQTATQVLSLYFFSAINLPGTFVNYNFDWRFKWDWDYRQLFSRVHSIPMPPSHEAMVFGE